MRIILILFLSIIFFTGNAYAYFDPGSGAFIIQAIVALFGAIILYISRPIIYAKKIIKIIKNKVFKLGSEKNEKGKSR